MIRKLIEKIKRLAGGSAKSVHDHAKKSVPHRNHEAPDAKPRRETPTATPPAAHGHGHAAGHGPAAAAHSPAAGRGPRREGGHESRGAQGGHEGRGERRGQGERFPERGERGGRSRGRRPERPAGPGPQAPAAADTAPAVPQAPWDPATFDIPVKEGASRFHDFNLAPEIMHAIADLGFQYCTPIQAASLPATLDGRDVAGRAQTGTGKTAAFLIAIFQHCIKHPLSDRRPARTPRAIVLAPTRELAMQIDRDAMALAKYCPIRVAAVYGGEDYDKQRRRMGDRPIDLVVATPGRLLDFRSRHDLHLGDVEILVIDEADRMLDMGFIPDVRKIVYSTPPKDRRQTLLFSATLSDTILRLASSWTRDPVRVEIEPTQVAVDTVRQIVYIVTAAEKVPLLYNIITREKPERTLMFVNRRDTAERVTEFLRRCGFSCALISGALNQAQRTRALEAFRSGEIGILVATDVAGRGLHIDAISHVVNYNVPFDAEDYVHRIGRTGRAGATGTSITFACEDESFYLPPIEKYIGRSLPYEHPDEAWVTIPAGVELPPLPVEHHRHGPPGGGRGGYRGAGGRRGPPRGGGRGGPRSGGRR